MVCGPFVVRGLFVVRGPAGLRERKPDSDHAVPGSDHGMKPRTGPCSDVSRRPLRDR